MFWKVREPFGSISFPELTQQLTNGLALEFHTAEKYRKFGDNSDVHAVLRYVGVLWMKCKAKPTLPGQEEETLRNWTRIRVSPLLSIPKWNTKSIDPVICHGFHQGTPSLHSKSSHTRRRCPAVGICTTLPPGPHEAAWARFLMLPKCDA